MKSFKRLTAVLMAALLLFVSASADVTGEQEYKYLHELVDFVVDNSKFGADKPALLDAALKARLTDPEGGFNAMVDAVMQCLDRNSSYLNASDYKSFVQKSVSGSFAGIGVSLTITDNRLVVVAPMDGSPAAMAGILPQDVLISVNGESVEGMTFDAVQARITGEIGTEVTVGINRAGEILSFTMLRAAINETTVTHEIMEGDVGYIKLPNFNAAGVDGVKAALQAFDAQGIKNILLDLRGNPGGELNAALHMCELFVPEGVVTRIEFADSANNQLYYNKTDGSGKYKLAVLVNQGSASASELFTGAVMDTGSGVSIGTTTFGKGTVQKLFPIVTGGALRLTVAEYKTAGGRAIHNIGLKPDIYVENTYETPDVSYILPIDFAKEWAAGDSGDGVLAVEQRLVFWNYMDEADTVMDDTTAAALRRFQVANRLEMTGRADVYTLVRMNDANMTEPIMVDKQLEAGLGYFHE